MISPDRLALAGYYLLDPNCLNMELGSKSVLEDFVEFPFLEHKNLECSSIKEESLLDNLAKACETSLSTAGELVLLLSSGKDSLSLAIAYAELGISINCVSLVTDDEESEYLTNITQRLGHKLQLVGLDQIRSASSAFVDVSLQNSEYICLDQAFYPIYLALKDYLSGQRVNLIDGMGNDIYFGHIPSRNQLTSFKYGGLRKLLPKSFGYYFRNFTAAMGLRTATSYILPPNKTMQTSNAFYNEFTELMPHSSKYTDIVDARAFIRGKYIDNFVYAEKTRVIGRLLKCNVSFPWMDQGLSEYCFNLPREMKYDFPNLENKILLRRLLTKKIGYSRPKKGIDVVLKLSEQEIVKILKENFVPDEYIDPILQNRVCGTAARKRALFEQLLLYKHKGETDA